MPTADYDAGCRVRSTSTKCPTRKSRTSSSPPISRPENALASRLLFRQFSKSLAKTCKSGSCKALLHLALESRGGLLGGLGGLLDKLQKGGLGDVANSWVGSGQNQPVTPKQLGPALGPDIIKTLAQRSGLSEEE